AKDHAPLSKSEVALIKEWIVSGAKWSSHWAFVPPVMPDEPKKTKFHHLATGSMDRFLFERLERENLEPGEVAESGRLLRRLSLALTGLPPTLKELDAFGKAWAENQHSAIETTVDELLGRPAFGERWAAMWLDLVRYADSGGLGQDQKRTIWAYRDWVVKAFNQDLPFDQFTIQQLAGDLLPEPSIDDLVATACQRNTQTNNEGGTDDEQFRLEAIIDRVNTTWQTWGSITFSCVQCHDHPYDPIRHHEYFQFMDFFNNSADSDLQNDAPLLKVPGNPAQYAEAAELRSRILRFKKEAWQTGADLRDATQWNLAKELSVSSNNASKYLVTEKDGAAEFHTVGTVETRTHTLIEASADNFSGEPVSALKLTVLPHDPDTAIHSPEWGFVLAKLEAWVVSADGKQRSIQFRGSVPDVPWMPTDPMKTIGNDGSSWGADSRIHHARQLVLIPKEPLSLAETETLRIHVHCNKTGHGSHPMAIQRGNLASTTDPRWTTHESAPSRELTEANRRYAGIKGTTVPVMLERPQNLARPTHLFARGNPMDKADLVAAGLPASLSTMNPVPSHPSRLDMARWWVSGRNPLTARVYVNRIWEQLFGVGIVPTLEDFGSSGEKPTHPELLDYLALRFQNDYDWSTKAILREIVLSYAYRQSSLVTPELLERDPRNQFLARGPRLRLTAEQVRDQSLALSGLLSEKVGGPPVHPPIPGGVWKPFSKSDKWATPQPKSEDRYRRSIYTYLKRSIPFPTFATFDAPSREFCNPRRLVSNTPLQALTTLNDPAFVECSEAFAERLESEFQGALRERLRAAHQLVSGRIASESRIDELEKLHQQVSSESPGQAWSIVAQVLLNLDETLTY
ncbi:MAG: DUF1549 and DUF1553 domain-containing protein, partial [Verrucomicrobiota bacterium]